MTALGIIGGGLVLLGFIVAWAMLSDVGSWEDWD